MVKKTKRAGPRPRTRSFGTNDHNRLYLQVSRICIKNQVYPQGTKSTTYWASGISARASGIWRAPPFSKSLPVKAKATPQTLKWKRGEGLCEGGLRRSDKRREKENNITDSKITLFVVSPLRGGDRRWGEDSFLSPNRHLHSVYSHCEIPRHLGARSPSGNARGGCRGCTHGRNTSEQCSRPNGSHTTKWAVMIKSWKQSIVFHHH